MKKALSLLFASFYSCILLAQLPGIAWKETYGHIIPMVTHVWHTAEPVATADGGFIFAAAQSSPPQNPAPKGGGSDIVLTKVDSNGMVQWKKTFGGNNTESSVGLRIIRANGGGYLFVAISYSTNGDLPANNDPNNGNLWFGKVNEQGTLVSSKILKSDYTLEILSSIIPASDGSGYLMTLNVYKSGGGSLPDGLLPRCSFMENSYKFVKIDNDINVVFQKCITAEYLQSQITVTAATGNKYLLFDNGYISGGNCSTLRPPSVSMIDDTMKLYWTKPVTAFGMPHNGYAFSGRSILKRSSNEFIIPFYNINWCPNNASGGNPLVLLNIDSTGTLIWKKLTSQQRGMLVTPTDAGDGNSFLVMRRRNDVFDNPTDSNVLLRFAYSDGTEIASRTLSVHPSNPYTEIFPVHSSTGQLHFWGQTDNGFESAIIFGKLGPVNQVTGWVYVDVNSNGSHDAGEPAVPQFKVYAAKTNGHSTYDFTNTLGAYSLTTDTGYYAITITGDGIENFTQSPASITISRSNTGYSDTVNIGLKPIANKSDVGVNIIPASVARPGFAGEYIIVIRNNAGNGSASGTVRLSKSPKMTYVSSSRPYASISGNQLEWNYANLGVLRTDTVRVRLQVAAPPSVNINDTLITSVKLTPGATQSDPNNDSLEIKEVARGAYDPNDKQERNAGRFSLAQLASGQSLQYTIRFQNTGNYPAETVVVRDTLSADFDLTTVRMIASSHKYDFDVRNNSQLIWTLNNIDLPDSLSNEPGSHGYVTFSVKLKPGLTQGAQVSNKASIYFDYNPAIVTNEHKTTLYVGQVTALNPVEVKSIQVSPAPNPFSGSLRMLLQSDRYYSKVKIKIVAMDGREVGVTESSLQAGSNWVLVPNKALSGAAYLVVVTVGEHSYSTRVIKQ